MSTSVVLVLATLIAAVLGQGDSFTGCNDTDVAYVCAGSTTYQTACFAAAAGAASWVDGPCAAGVKGMSYAAL